MSEKSYYEVIRDISEKTDLDVFVIINGMCNTANESRERALWLANMVTPHPVVMVYNATHGFFIDLRESDFNVNWDIATTPAYVLHNAWRYILERASPEAKIWTYGHSQGTAHIFHGLRMLEPDARQRIHVRAFAPAKYIPDRMCRSIVHYRAEWYRDVVPNCDGYGKKMSRHNTIILKTPSHAPFQDHTWLGSTYGPALLQDVKSTLKEIAENETNHRVPSLYSLE